MKKEDFIHINLFDNHEQYVNRLFLSIAGKVVAFDQTDGHHCLANGELWGIGFDSMNPDTHVIEITGLSKTKAWEKFKTVLGEHHPTVYWQKKMVKANLKEAIQ